MFRTTLVVYGSLNINVPIFKFELLKYIIENQFMIIDFNRKQILNHSITRLFAVIIDQY
jgi:hypothetical protein